MDKLKLDSVTIKVNKKGQAKETYKVKEYDYDKNEYKETGETAQRNIYTLPYKTRKKLFANSNNKLVFNPKEMIAHSYDWYIIAKMIGNTFVLNTYNYSSTTNKHVHQLRRLFDQLKLKYIEIEAPRGLQDLNSSMDYHSNNVARKKIEEKFGRRKRYFKFDNKAITFLSKHVKKIDIEPLLESHESYRLKKLERLKKERWNKKLDFISGKVDKI